MGRIEVGSEIRFFKWDTDHHDAFRALVRDWTGNQDGHPDVDVSYYDGTPTNQNAVPNEEDFPTQGDLDEEDYWKHAFHVDKVAGDSKPYVNPRPDVGDVVWYFRYDGTIEEHITHPAIVRNVSAGSTPPIALFYITDAGSRQNANAITAFLDITFPTTDDYWARRRLASHES